MESFLDLVDRLDTLCRSARDQAVAGWVRQADAGAIDSALADAGRGDAWLRAIGVFVAGLAGRDDVLLASLTDPSLRVRRAAVSHAAVSVGDVAALVSAALSAVPATRAALAETASRRRRVDLAGPLAAALVAHGDLRAARPLFEWCEVGVLTAIVAERGVGAVRWSRTADRHPDFVLDVLRTELQKATNQSAIGIAWTVFGGGLPALARRRPAELLALWQELGPTDWLPPAFARCWPDFLRAAPDTTIALLCRTLAAAPHTRVPRSVFHRAVDLPEEALFRLAAALAPAVDALTALLAALPPSRRAAVWEAAMVGYDTCSSEWPEPLLTVLPHPVRQAEARRMLALPAVQRDPERALWITACLGVDEALPALTRQSRAAKGEDRAVGWALRIACNARNRAGLDETLQAMRLMKNEQDPVRYAAFNALCRVPVRLFEPSHAGILRDFVGFAVNARDTSAATRTALQSLAQRLLVAWAETPESALFQASLEMMLALAQHQPYLAFPSLERGLRRGAEVALVDALLPWLRQEVAREFNSNVLGLAVALGRRAWPLLQLQEVLERVVFTAKTSASWHRQRAAELWLADPKRRDQRVRAVLDYDESAVVLHAVWRHVHLRRQDWLDPFIEGRVLRGRFSSSKAGWIFPADRGFDAWLPRQQRVFAKTLRRMVGDKGQHATTRAWMVRRLAALPTTTVADLEPFTVQPDIIVAEAALGALVWLDEPADGLGLLLDNLGSDRARVAMYAMPRLARLVPARAMFATLSALLTRETIKVTVHKEAVRLLGGLRLEGVADLLWGQWSRTDLHRDVRVALLHAARQRLDEPTSWSMLEAAVGHAERDVAQAVVQARHADVAPAHRERYAGLVLALADHPSPELRKALMKHLGEAVHWGVEQPVRAVNVCCAALTSALRDAAWQEAAVALAGLAITPDAVLALATHLRALTERMLAEPVESAPDEEDLGAQRRLEAVYTGLSDVGVGDRARTREARVAALAVASQARVWLWDEVVALTLADLEPEPGIAETLRELEAAAPGPLEAASLADTVASWALDAARRCTAEALLALVGLLGDRSWIALGLARAAGMRFGWGQPARRALAGLRRDATLGPQARRVWVR